MTAHHTDSHWPLLPNSWTAGPFISSLSKELMRLMYLIIFFSWVDIAHWLLACQLNPRADGGSLMLAANFYFNQV